MIHSMTAFARAENQAGHKYVSVEIRSVNHRFCEVSARLPRPWIGLEERIKNTVRKHVARGRVEVSLEIQDTEAGGQVYEADVAQAKAYFEAVSHVREALGMETPVSLESIVRLNGVITARSAKPNLETDWAVVETALVEGLDVLAAMRETEGKSLYDDFLHRLDLLESFLEKITQAAKDQPALHLAKLKERMAALVESAGDLDPARLAQEAAFLADKSDITEELVRAQSHIDQFRTILDQEEPPGRSLNFLAQELHREFSTMGSKSSDADLSHLVVDAKAEVEKIREQVQNVE